MIRQGENGCRDLLGLRQPLLRSCSQKGQDTEQSDGHIDHVAPRCWWYQSLTIVTCSQAFCAFTTQHRYSVHARIAAEAHATAPRAAWIFTGIIRRCMRAASHLHRVRRAWREESHSQQSAYNREDTEGHDVGAAERYRLTRAARNESAKLLRQATLRENASCAAAPEK